MNVGISTFIPNKDMGNWIGRALDSICSQSMKPLEVYVLDDNSEDNSCLVVLDKKAQYEGQVEIKLIHYEQKAKDWLLSLHEHYHLAQGELINSISADDFLLPDFYKQAIDGIWNWTDLPGLVMGDWFAVDVNQRSKGIAACGFQCIQGFYQDSNLMNQLCKPRFFEGGPCALVRKDELLWLHSQEFHKLGSWNDSMGYSVAAWRKGAVYLAKPFGALTLFDDGSGFNDQEKRDENKAFAKFKQVWQFFHRPEIVQSCPMQLRTALANKVFRTLTRVNQDRWDWEFHNLYSPRTFVDSLIEKELVRCSR